jgi:RNA polymerase sigma factor (sigma-70 family)
MAEILQHAHTRLPGQMTLEELLSACARNRDNFALWTEFLSRYGRRIRQFIKGTLCLTLNNTTAGEQVEVLGGMQAGDLFQSVILRLVENDCAALGKFSGRMEYEWLAYLAVITRSVVRETLRRQRALKRPGRAEIAAPGASEYLPPPREGGDPNPVERQLLAREVRKLGEQAIHSLGGETSQRDMLIFQLYFDHDLSLSQISRWQNVNLSKTGVEKTLARLKELIRSVVAEEAPKETM